jgi:SAM-dependent methyltransferase
MRDETLPVSHFEALYGRSPDPWRFATSAYEAAKYDATLAALPRAHYARALDVGCSIGVFTERLAERCSTVLGLEPVEAALAAARDRNAHHAHVRFAAAFVPRDWPDAHFDLVVLSEVLDYLSPNDVAAVAACLGRTVEPGGDVVLVHWVGKKPGTGARPDEASEILIAASRDVLRPLHQQRNADYRLDVLRRDR